MNKKFYFELILALFMSSMPSYAEIKDSDYILKGKTIESSLKESVEKWSSDVFDNSISIPIVVIAIAGEDITESNPETRDELRTQKFRILKNISGKTEENCIFVYSVFPSHGERKINKNEKIIGILKKYKQEKKYHLLLAVTYSESNKNEIIKKLNF
jgi:hypothetical protein